MLRSVVLNHKVKLVLMNRAPPQPSSLNFAIFIATVYHETAHGGGKTSSTVCRSSLSRKRCEGNSGSSGGLIGGLREGSRGVARMSGRYESTYIPNT